MFIGFICGFFAALLLCMWLRSLDETTPGPQDVYDRGLIQDAKVVLARPSATNAMRGLLDEMTESLQRRIADKDFDK